jgi:LPS sulfotransferase NodH
MAHSTLSYADDSAMTQNAGQNEQAAARRSQAPVFVLGCPRSGTTVLYHMLLSAGGFAVYRAESQVFTLLSPRFGGLRSVSSRKEWLRTWEKSKLFRASGLDFHTVRDKLLKDCRNPGDCLQTFMNEIARVQGVERWADCTPDHLLYIREIKRQIPNALVVHIIRDGRDVALSYARQGWSHPLPWDRRQQLGVAALYWAWVVGQGRKNGRDLGEDYIEIRYEDLVGNPREVLNQISAFIDQDLDYEHILKVGIGSVSSPNTSFGQDAGGNFNPVGRWKTKLPAPQLAMLESVIGDRLQELGYGLSQDLNIRVRARYMRLVYPQLFATKLWLKDHTPLGRFTDTGPMEISD